MKEDAKNYVSIDLDAILYDLNQNYVDSGADPEGPSWTIEDRIGALKELDEFFARWTKKWVTKEPA
jgi:hypothetical protein